MRASMRASRVISRVISSTKNARTQAGRGSLLGLKGEGEVRAKAYRESTWGCVVV